MFLYLLTLILFFFSFFVPDFFWYVTEPTFLFYFRGYKHFSQNHDPTPKNKKIYRNGDSGQWE